MTIATASQVFTNLLVPIAKRTDDLTALVEQWLSLCLNKVKDFVGYEIELNTFTEYFPDINTVQDDDLLVDGWEVIGGRVVPRGMRGGQARGIIALRNLPIRSVTSVYETPAAWDTDPPVWPDTCLLNPGPDYRVDWEDQARPGTDPSYPRLCWTGHILRRIGVWCPVSRCSKITYLAGFTDLELAGRWSVFKTAVIMETSRAVKESQVMANGTGIVTQLNVDGYDRKFADPSKALRFDWTIELSENAKQMLRPYQRMGKFFY